jgi:hypothetical protein
VEYGAQPTFYFILIIYIKLVLVREYGSLITNNTVGDIIYGEDPVNYYIYYIYNIDIFIY